MLSHKSIYYNDHECVPFYRNIKITYLLQITEQLNKSTTNHEIRLIGRKSPYISPNSLPNLSPDNGDVGISLHLG